MPAGLGQVFNMNNPLAARPKPAAPIAATQTTDITKPLGMKAAAGGEESKEDEEESKDEGGTDAATKEEQADSNNEVS